MCKTHICNEGLLHATNSYLLQMKCYGSKLNNILHNRHTIKHFAPLDSPWNSASNGTLVP